MPSGTEQATEEDLQTEQHGDRDDIQDPKLHAPSSVTPKPDTDAETHSIVPESADDYESLWNLHESQTKRLAATLCERLRLVLIPTVAAKLRGDYKSGRRLNMRRIIPYIASDFNKDKIWLRRTKPNKRRYQIMLTIDDSRSMRDSGSISLALDAIAMVSMALTLLESGDLSIFKFGEVPTELHAFSERFTRSSGFGIFREFTFDAHKTDLVKLLERTNSVFKTSRASLRATDADIWQMQMIVSDGICENHSALKLLLREAFQSKIMVIFIVLDIFHSGKTHSILDMQEARYVENGLGGKTLQVRPYMEEFPFSYRIVLQDISELPQSLSSCLQQFFQSTSNMKS